jgi:hypothetical protein
MPIEADAMTSFNRARYDATQWNGIAQASGMLCASISGDIPIRTSRAIVLEELSMLWMLLPPNANNGRHLEAPSVTSNGTWAAKIRAVLWRKYEYVQRAQRRLRHG